MLSYRGIALNRGCTYLESYSREERTTLKSYLREEWTKRTTKENNVEKLPYKIPMKAFYKVGAAFDEYCWKKR